ncbi:MAG: hypothetical protein KFF73_15415 [Cyclobacteriaceae bacterium]|nr:hypothetical protein [Cyclobacteriaceae bacterium]
MKKLIFKIICILFPFILLISACNPPAPTLWELANENRDLLRVSTIFTAQDVRDKLSYGQGLDSAIIWCKNAGVTRVFVESFRNGYTADRETLINARDSFEEAGIEASGCVTTTQMGKFSSAGSIVSCYTSEETHKELVRIFEYTASLFDVIMIDDFLFTTCECEECQAARGEKSWSDYRCDLMNEVSREYILKPARKVNPEVKVINKFPQWYDSFHLRGYEVLGETESYDIIWVGTESRDNDFVNNTPGLNTPQYESYFIMRWLGEIGGEKTGGGWFDALGTTPKTYLEQARQTVLADAREMMLFSYGGLNRETNTYGQRQGTGIANIEALKVELPALFELAELVHRKPIRGVLAVKPANSHPHLPDTVETVSRDKEDAFIYDFIGMLGIPLVPSEKIDMNADAAFFPIQILKDPEYRDKLSRILADKKPVLITDGLASQVENVDQYENLTVLNVDGDPKNLLRMSREELKPIRDRLLAPFGITFDAPSRVALYLFGDDLYVIENFRDEEVAVTLETKSPVKAQIKLVLPVDAETRYEFGRNKLVFNRIPPRTLVAITYK